MGKRNDYSFKKTNKAQGHRALIVKNSLITVLILTVAVVLAETMQRLKVGPQDSMVVYLLAIFIIAASTDGYVYSIAATLAGVFIYDFLITFPRLKFSFTIGFPVTLCLMLLVALTTSTVTIKIKTTAKIAREKERRAELLYEINQQLLSSRTVETIVEHALDYLGDFLARSVVFVQKQQDIETQKIQFRQGLRDVNYSFFTEKENLLLLEQAFIQQRMMPASLPQSEMIAYPVILQEEVLGVLGISCKSGELEDSELDFVALIARQAAQALQLQVLAAKQQEVQVLVETEKARSSFLRAISHDLRTPLTTILGASAVLVENGEDLDLETRAKLAKGIYDDCGWLLNMVQNLLSVTRIHNANMSVEKTVEAAEEVVAGAVSAVRKRFPEASISISMPEELLLVPMDGILISQVLTNLMDNALRHGGDSSTLQIVVSAAQKGDYVEFIVADNGKGINSQRLPRLFEMHSSGGLRPEDASRGLGMGLSICKTIIEAHGGTIHGENRPQGGAEFRFTLPL